MLESSFVVRIVIFLCNVIFEWYRHSFLCRMVKAVSSFIIKSWHASFAYRVLYKETDFDVCLANSVAGKLLLKITAWLSKTRHGFEEAAGTSRLVSAIDGLGKNILDLNLEYYARFFVIYTVFNLVLSLKNSGLFHYTALLVSILFFFFCRMANTSLSLLYNGSFLARFAGGYFGLELPGRLSAVKPKFLFELLGLVLALGSMKVSAFYLFFGLIAVLGAVLILYSPLVGVMVTAFAIPILPTMLILGLEALTVFSFLCKLLFSSQYTFKINMIDLFILLFAVLVICSVPISYIPGSSASVAVVYLLFIAFYFVVKNVINTREKLFAVASLLVCAGVLVALYGILQKYTGIGMDTEAWIDAEMFGDQSRIGSTLENPNVLGEYFLFVIPVALSMLYYFNKARNLPYKAVAFGALGVMGVAMLFTSSRGAWLGLIVAMVVFTLVKDRRLIWLGVLVLMAAPFAIPASYMERFFSIGNMADTSTAYRVSIWMASTNMLKDFWPVGIGLSSNVFIYIFQKYAYSASYALHSHNLYLQVMLTLGISGFILFLLILFMFYKNILSRINKSKSSFLTAFSASLCAGMTGYLVQGMTDNTWYNYRIVSYFWVVLALAGVCGCLMADKENAVKT